MHHRSGCAYIHVRLSRTTSWLVPEAPLACLGAENPVSNLGSDGESSSLLNGKSVDPAQPGEPAISQIFAAICGHHTFILCYILQVDEDPIAPFNGLASAGHQHLLANSMVFMSRTTLLILSSVNSTIPASERSPLAAVEIGGYYHIPYIASQLDGMSLEQILWKGQGASTLAHLYSEELLGPKQMVNVGHCGGGLLRIGPHRLVMLAFIR